MPCPSAIAAASVCEPEGLSYRDIGAVLCVSLGAVARSLTRAMTRLARVDGG
jgi:DNA-directed RNA polymerase specialized sigma24 family protein